jgi:hypothetical protein
MFFSLSGEMLFFFIFIITGYLTSFFSKNMIVILVVAMTVTHCLRFGKKATGNEGMTNKKESFDPNADITSLETAPAGIDTSTSVQKAVQQPGLQKPSTENNDKKISPAASLTNVATKGPAGASTSTVSAIDKLNNSTAQIQQIKDNLQSARAKNLASPNAAAFNPPAPASSSFKPSELSDLMNIKIDSPLAINNSKPVVSGFENLDAQTKKLLNTQQELMHNMDNLSPLLAQAEKFMEKFQGLAK